MRKHGYGLHIITCLHSHLFWSLSVGFSLWKVSLSVAMQACSRYVNTAPEGTATKSRPAKKAKTQQVLWNEQPVGSEHDCLCVAGCLTIKEISVHLQL